MRKKRCLEKIVFALLISVLMASCQRNVDNISLPTEPGMVSSEQNDFTEERTIASENDASHSTETEPLTMLSSAETSPDMNEEQTEESNTSLQHENAVNENEISADTTPEEAVSAETTDMVIEETHSSDNLSSEASETNKDTLDERFDLTSEEESVPMESTLIAETEPATEAITQTDQQINHLEEYINIFEETELPYWEVTWEVIVNYDPQVRVVLTADDFAVLEAYVTNGINAYKASGTEPSTEATGNSSLADGVWHSDRAREAFDLQNQYRANAGLSELAWNDLLYAACEIRSKELVTSFSHTRPDGTMFITVFDEVGYGAGRGGRENAAMGEGTATVIVLGWYDSEGHRENMLSTDVIEGAIACYCLNGIYYWVALFSR